MIGNGRDHLGRDPYPSLGRVQPRISTAPRTGTFARAGKSSMMRGQQGSDGGSIGRP
jgi:hypothetical protein